MTAERPSENFISFLFQHLDTSLVNLDIEPTYLRAMIKGKLFQLRFLEDVRSDAATATRSQTTGHMIIKMPKAKPTSRRRRTPKQKESSRERRPPPIGEKEVGEIKENKLEVTGTNKEGVVDLRIVVEREVGSGGQNDEAELPPPLEEITRLEREEEE